MKLLLKFIYRLLFVGTLFAFEPQDILDVKNVALAPNKQLNYLTPVAAGSYTQRPRNPGTAFASRTPTFYSDESLANKGDNFPRTKQRIMQATEFDATWDMDNFSLGWALAFALGAVTVTGTGPYTHVFKFLQSTNQMPVTSILFQDTNDVIYQLPDLAIGDLQISGKESGPLQMQFKATGSGKDVPGAVAFPAIAQNPQYLFGSDTDILMGPPAPDSSTFTLSTVVAGALAAHTAFWKITGVNAAGETLASAEISIAVPANSVSKIVAPAAFPPGITSWNVYGSNTTGTETKQGNIAAGGGNLQEPNTGFAAGTALPTVSTALSSIKERVVQWSLDIKASITPNRAPGVGLFATFTKVLKQRVNLTLQVKATSTDDIAVLCTGDVLRNIQIKCNSGAAQQFTFDLPGVYPVAHAASASGQEVMWPITAGDQDIVKWQGQEYFTATVMNNQPAYLVGA